MRVFFMTAFPFVVGCLLAPMLIKMLHQLKFGQEVRREGPQSHLKKQGTPTMGGLLFIVLFLAYVPAFRLFTYSVTYVLASVLLFSAIGFVDDYLKIRRRSSDGLSSKQKLVLQFVVSVLLSVSALHLGTTTVFPFWKVIDLGMFYVPILVLMYVSLTNAVNLTDGLDGLATSVTGIVVIMLGAVAYVGQIVDVFEMCLIMFSGMMAFLVFNRYPAKVIMGDTGSFALGGFVAATSVVLGIPLLVPIFGMLYVIEALSVMIQVAYYKRTRKRIFKMSPIHHHFELSGYSEVRIVILFSCFTAFCSAIGYLAWYLAF